MSIDEQIKVIEKEIFDKTNYKLDSYTLAIIRANLLGNEKLAQNRTNTRSCINVSPRIELRKVTNVFVDEYSSLLHSIGFTVFPCIVLFFSVITYFFMQERGVGYKKENETLQMQVDSLKKTITLKSKR
jgi:hypothetical protein